MAKWRSVLAACALLAIPTAIAPDSTVAASTYLAGLGLIVAALWWGTMRLPPAERGPWQFLSAAASCWLLGDVLQRAQSFLGRPYEGVGLPDLFWLASYPLIIVAVAGMIRARGLPPALLRGIRLDVIVVGAAASVGAWHLLIAPTLGDGVAVSTTVVGALYPLGDVAIFALAVTLVLTPGHRGVASVLLISCLGLTLPLDFLATILPQVGSQLDAALLVVNGLLGAAAVHAGRGELTSKASVDGPHAMHRWRVVLLGTSLCTVSVVSAIPSSGSSNLVPSLAASIAVSVTVVIRFYRAVRERDAAEAALTYQAHHDQLTGAANRLLLMDRLSATVRRQGSQEQGLVLVFIDLDGFKKVNDTWGHPAGDEVLRAVAQRLAELVRPTDTVARVGGDEFVVLCHGVGSEHAEALGHRIRAAVGRPIEVGPAHVRIGASVGVLTATATSLSPARDSLLAADDLLRRADWAMYEAKRGGGGVRTAQPEPVAV
jgi:diguanylate cyclase (GGDEF)-like protein